MATKWYLHDAASPNGGTLPSGDLTTIDGGPDFTATGAAVNRAMDATIGALQVAVAKADLAQAGSQEGFYRMFLSPPIAAQTIAAQTVTLRVGIQQSNIDSNLQLNIAALALWRPSTGALVASGTLLALSNSGAISAVTTEQDFSWAATSTSVTAQDGDIVVLVVYLRPVHGAASSYTDSLMYDGTVEGSTTTNAAYLLFANTITLSSGGGGSTAGALYLHDASTTVGGILPSGDQPSITGSPDRTAAGATTMRSMDPNIGSLQVTASLTDNAVAGSQEAYMRTFVSPPLAAQTIAAQTVTLRAGVQQSNIDSNVQLNIAALYLWRPSTGAIIGTLLALSNSGGISAVTTEQDFSWAATSSSVVAAAGDVLVLEVFLRPVHGAASAYVDSFMYDGTTVGSTTSNAAALTFATPLTLQSGVGSGYGASTGELGMIFADMSRSAHRLPWMTAPSKFGRVGRGAVLLGATPVSGGVVGSGGSSFGFSSSGVGTSTPLLLQSFTVEQGTNNDVIAQDGSGVIRATVGEIGPIGGPADYGLRVRSPAGVYTIIDGSSDMFRIAATGTITKAFPVAGNSAQANVVLTGLGSGYSVVPATIFMVTYDNSNAATNRLSGIDPVLAANGQYLWAAYGFAYLTGGQIGVGIGVISAAFSPGTTGGSRFYVLAQVGI